MALIDAFDDDDLWCEDNLLALFDSEDNFDGDRAAWKTESKWLTDGAEFGTFLLAGLSWLMVRVDDEYATARLELHDAQPPLDDAFADIAESPFGSFTGAVGIVQRHGRG